MKQMPSIKRNALLNMLHMICSFFIPLFTYPYITGALGVEGIGRTSFASTFVAYFSLIAALGFGAYASRTGVKYRDDRVKINRFCSELFTLNIVSAVVACILLLCFFIVVKRLHAYMLLILLYSLNIVFFPFGMEWLFVLFEDYKYVTFRNIIFNLIYVVLLILFINDSGDTLLFAGISVFVTSGENILNFYYARKYVDISLLINTNCIEHIKHSVIFFFSQIASSIYSNIDNTMLGFMSSDYTVGLYSAAVKIYSAVIGVIGAVISVTTPRLSYYKYNGKQEEFNCLVTKIIKYIIIIGFPATIGLICTSEEVIVCFIGMDFLYAVDTLKILAFAGLVSCFAGISSKVLCACQKERYMLVGTVAAAVTNVIFNIFLLPLYGQNGAALTTVVAEIVIVFVGIFNCRKDVSVGNIKNVVMTTLVGCGVVAFCSFCVETMVVSLIVRLVLKVIICVIAYFIVLIVLKNEVIIEYATVILNKIIGMCNRV